MLVNLKEKIMSQLQKIFIYFYSRKINKDTKLEYEFLPSSQEILEKPPSPLGRIVVYLIFIFLSFVILWSYFGKVDKVATGYGKIVPKGKLKIIKPRDGGVITGIHVYDGQKVKKGQLLLELDNVIKKADVDILRERLKVLELEKKHLISELGIENSINEELEVFNNIKLKKHMVRYQKMLNEKRKLKFQEKIKTTKLNIEQKNKDKTMAISKMVSLNHKDKYFSNLEKIERESYIKGFSSKAEWENKKYNLDLNQQEIVIQKLYIEKLDKSIEESKEKLALIKEEQAAYLIEEIIKKDKEISSLNSELTKADKRFKYQKIYSPVDGIVNGFSTHTLGGVINPAESIITIVPKGTTLIAEIFIKNSDIGFIKLNQEVELKMDTFPFQDYGTIEGKITFISPDSVELKDKNLVYKAQVSLDKDSLLVGGINKKISPGMTLRSEVKIGRRRIIDFFLSPYKKSLKEALIIR